MSGESEHSIDRREAPRVDAFIPLEVTLISDEERENIYSRRSGIATVPDLQSLPDLEDKLLNEWMKMLNAKLDVILNLLTYQREGYYSLPPVRATISGSGMSFHVNGEYRDGDVLEIKMMLPLSPPVGLLVYGEVVKVERHMHGYTVAVKFMAIDEELRDEIMKFVFKRQKEILREKRR